MLSFISYNFHPLPLNTYNVQSQQDITYSFEPIDKLQQFNINASDLTKLRVGGITTVFGLLQCTRRQLLKIKARLFFIFSSSILTSLKHFNMYQGLSEVKVEKLKEAAQKCQKLGFLTGIEVSKRRENIINISTGSKNLDSILGGNYIHYYIFV